VEWRCAWSSFQWCGDIWTAKFADGGSWRMMCCSKHPYLPYEYPLTSISYIFTPYFSLTLSLSLSLDSCFVFTRTCCFTLRPFLFRKILPCPIFREFIQFVSSFYAHQCQKVPIAALFHPFFEENSPKIIARIHMKTYLWKILQFKRRQAMYVLRNPVVARSRRVYNSWAILPAWYYLIRRQRLYADLISSVVIKYA
jgi:hypothetical protein